MAGARRGRAARIGETLRRTWQPAAQRRAKSARRARPAARTRQRGARTAARWHLRTRVSRAGAVSAQANEARDCAARRAHAAATPVWRRAERAALAAGAAGVRHAERSCNGRRSPEKRTGAARRDAQRRRSDPDGRSSHGSHLSSVRATRTGVGARVGDSRCTGLGIPRCRALRRAANARSDALPQPCYRNASTGRQCARAHKRFLRHHATRRLAPSRPRTPNSA